MDTNRFSDNPYDTSYEPPIRAEVVERKTSPLKIAAWIGEMLWRAFIIALVSFVVIASLLSLGQNMK